MTEVPGREPPASAIKSMQECIVDACEERAKTAQLAYGDAVRSVYTQEHGAPVHIGSCILISYLNQKYILTAAHVVDATRIDGMWVAGDKKLIVIGGIWNTSPAPATGRKDDPFDFAFLELTSQIVEDLGAVCFIADKHLERNMQAHASHVHCCIGYPNTKNRKVKPGNVVRTQPYIYWSARSNSTNPRPGVFLNTSHVFLKFDKGMVGVGSTGRQVNPPNLHGMSGGAIVRLLDAKKPTDLVPSDSVGPVVGLTIEYHERHKAIVAVRIDLVLEQIDLVLKQIEELR